MHPFKTDISVLLLFHARADHFSKVWEEVRKARPARLFLYQDGPRMVDYEGNAITDVEQSKDWKGIIECRQLVSDEQIDWQCEVHRLYQTRNYGCDPSEFISQRWAFSLTDKCIVLEDDDVPSQSFFPFCKEMLDRYEHDERITMIAGFNTDEDTSRYLNNPLRDVVPESASPLGFLSPGNGETERCVKTIEAREGAQYFFTRAFSIWGWASWSRVVNNWDGNYGFVRDPQQWQLLQQKCSQYGQRREMLALCQQHAEAGKEYYETIFWAYMMLHDGMAIMPRVNLINNIGLDGGTHYATQLELQPKRLRRQFEIKRLEMHFPLVHPNEVKEYPDYQKRWYLRNAWNNPWRKVQYSLEELWLNLRHGNFKFIAKSIINRLKKI